MAFHWSLNDSKSPYVSRTLLSILADLNNTVVGMVSSRPAISKSCPFNNLLVTVPRATITIVKIVNFTLHSFFSIPKQNRGTSSAFHFLKNFTLLSAETANSTFLQDLFHLLIITRSGHLAVCNFKVTQKFVCLILQDRFLIVPLPFVFMIKFNFFCIIPSRSPCPPNHV